MPSSGASSISARRTHLHSLPDSNHPAAATPTEWQVAPATRVTPLLPGRYYYQGQECLKSTASRTATQYSTTHTKTPALRASSHSQNRKTAKHNSQMIRIVFNIRPKQLYCMFPLVWLKNLGRSEIFFVVKVILDLLYVKTSL